MTSAPPTGRRQELLLAARALAVGAAGGLVFELLGLPLPWMLGAMTATTIAALCGLELGLGRGPRGLFFAVLAVMLGSAFSLELIMGIWRWSSGLLLLAVYVPLVTTLCYVFFRRVGGFDRTTAYLSSLPGGLGEMVMLSEILGGDSLRVTLVHTTRILLLVLVVPLAFRLGGYITAAPPPAGGPLTAMAPLDALLLAGCAVAGGLGGGRLRLPAPWFLGPLVLSALLHITGLTASRPPQALIWAAQLGIGAAIGSRFSGLDWKRVSTTIALAAVATALMVAVSALLTGLFHAAVPAAPAALLLSLAPGGMVEMALVALALGVEAAYVSTMHVIRLALVVSLAPFGYRLLPTDQADSG